MLTMWLVVTTFTVLTALLVSLVKRSTSYWTRRGVAQLSPLPLLGNYLPVLTLNKNSFDIYQQAYEKFPSERLVGIYELTNPTLVVRDPQLVEQVLVRDFTSYPDHGDFIFEPASALHFGLFNLYGDRWRALRNKLLGTFTTGRMRVMFPGLTESCARLLDSGPKVLDREALSRHAVDSFMRGLFGVELRPKGEREFRDNVASMFQAPLFRYLQQQLLIYYPRLGAALGCRYMPGWMDDYFRSVVRTILAQREDGGLQRRDFADLLLQLKSDKTAHVFDRANNKTHKTFELSEELVVCQAFMFFFAGMDTTSLAMLYTLYELARHPAAQERARLEVRDAIAAHRGLTYDAVRSLGYVERCIQEALRLHPSLVFLMRETTRTTDLGGVRLEPRTRLIVPNLSLQLDPGLFPRPLTFDPDRTHHKYAHLPFSDGPRVCVGKKFSLVEIATLVAHLLPKYQLSVDPSTRQPLEYQERTVFLTPKHPVLIRLEPL